MLTGNDGGCEFGPPWHEAGRVRFKDGSHAEFAAVEGASNAGLLIANMQIRFCRYFGALPCILPLTDIRGYSRLYAATDWLSEYGEEWKDLASISAYREAVIATGYGSAMLIITNQRNDRVHPRYARKYAAKPSMLETILVSLRQLSRELSTIIRHYLRN